MKNHKRKTINLSIYELEGSIESICNTLREYSENLIDPVIEVEWNYDYVDLKIVGWVPMTEKEIATAERKAEREKAKKKEQEEKQIEYERKELERLAKKFKVRITNE